MQQAAGFIDAVALQKRVRGYIKMSEEGPIKLAAAYTGVPRDILHLDIAGVIVLDKAQGLMSNT